MVVRHELLLKEAHLINTGHHAKQYWSRREAVLVAITNQYWSTQRAVLVVKTTAQIVQKRITPQAAEATWGVMRLLVYRE